MFDDDQLSEFRALRAEVRGTARDPARPRGRSPKLKHGMKGTPELKAWTNARKRCTDSAHPDWKNYGARGITMCPEWTDSFLSFYEHIGPRPVGLTLDRIDNNRGYEPGNVRWATRATQTKNRRRKHP